MRNATFDMGNGSATDGITFTVNPFLAQLGASASTRPVVAGDHSTLGDELILQISLNIFCFLNEN